MATSFTWNKVCLVGYLVNDPISDTTKNGFPMSKFVILTHCNKDVVLVPVICFRVTAEKVNLYLKKRSLVLVEGELNKYIKDTNKSGYLYDINVIAKKVIFLARPSLKNDVPNENEESQDQDIAQSFNQAYLDDNPDMDSPF